MYTIQGGNTDKNGELDKNFVILKQLKEKAKKIAIPGTNRPKMGSRGKMFSS